jgi:hypothetical protein
MTKMAENVLVDAQFSFVKPVQPLADFEEIYQGLDGTTPIAFPGALDPNSGKTGFADNLLAGIKMPSLGARVKIWIPMTLFADLSQEGLLVPKYGYEYELKWRLRNQNDYTGDAEKGIVPPMPFSLPTQELGYQNSSAKRYFFPCGTDVLLYEDTEPTVNGVAGIINVRTQRYRPLIETTALPVNAGGVSTVWQQGTYQDAAAMSNPGGASYMILDVEVQGNELSIWAFKIDSGEDWDFTSAAADLAFSYTFGTSNGTRVPDPNVGILVTSGCASP